MSFEVEGKLHKKFETEDKTATFKAREFVIEIADGQYPQLIKFQLVQDRCSLLDNYEEGEDIKVHFDLRGREWQDKYFTNLNAWRLEKAGVNSPAPAPNNGSSGGSVSDSSFPSVEDDPGGDDLPF